MNNLVTTTTTGGFDLEPKDLSEAKELASMIASTNLVPKQYQGKPADCLVCIMMGNELKLKAMQSLQHIAVINGKPSIYGDAMLAIVRNHPEFNKIEETFDEETETAFCAIHRRGQAVVEQRFSKADAITAGLWGKKGASGQPSAWVTYPRRMLQMRARGFALRDAFADALLGLITSEEARDIPSELVEDPIPEATSTEYAVADLNASLARLEQKEA
ncbi:MAG: hypothetical protein KJN67_05035, partial [Pontiella sp.]|nr:hypothetical protein [Pontiella sp.]